MRTSIASIAATALLLASCKDPPAPPTASAASATPSASASAPKAPAAPRPSSPVVASAAPRGSASAAPSGSAASRGPALTLDPKTLDVATGALVALAGELAVVRRKDGELRALRLGDKVTPLEDDGAAFTLTKTSLVERPGGGGAAYYVASGKLVRRVIDDKGVAAPAEVLAEDAEEYPPHAVRLDGGGDAAAYVARRTNKDGERRARLWVEGKGTHDLSPDGSGAASVFLVPLASSRLGAVWLDQRAALAPIHAAWIDLSAAPRIEREGVAWIAPPSELASLVSAVQSGDVLVALTAGPKDGAAFGLASVPIVAVDRPRDDALWLDYPNGLDPAPAVPIVVCDRAMVVLARPTARPVDSPRVVALATVDPSGVVTERAEVGRAGRVDHVAAWGTRDHGWIAWVGDGRTRVRRVKCGK